MELRKIAEDNLIFKCISGSNIYGTVIDKSDKDYVGIFIPPEDFVIGLYRCDQVEFNTKTKNDIKNSPDDIDYVIYSLPKFIKLALDNNPNIIELFYAPPGCILFCNDFGSRLLENKNLFLSKKAYHTFKGYAYSQKQRLLTQNPIGSRKSMVEKYGYDLKFASHLIRLLLECHEILVEKNIYLPLKQNNLVRDIKIGKHDLEFVLSKATQLDSLIDLAYTTSDLQNSADFIKINQLQIQLLKDYWETKEEIRSGKKKQFLI